MYDNDFSEVFEKINLFNKFYEIARFVDPILKKVIIYKNKNISEINVDCFEFWNKIYGCKNCISIRAFNENETFIKIEYSDQKIYMVTAIPANIQNRRIIIELLKDITKSLVFESSANIGIESGIHTLIENMNNLALNDSLTGVYNKRFINERLPLNIMSSILLNQNLSVIISDIDHFKNVNDTYGHLAGDHVLMCFAETLKSCLKRESDWIARFGGEEFLICMPDASIEKTIEIAESMRISIANKKIKYNNNTIKITASFGIWNSKPNSCTTADQIISIADEKLYLAKNNGRNKVEY